MNAKHTPGPYRVIEHNWSDTSICAGDKLIASLSIKNDATEDNQEELEDWMKAQANLFAAAPEMLAMLERINRLIITNWTGPRGGLGCDFKNQLKKIIAKAKGKM